MNRTMLAYVIPLAMVMLTPAHAANVYNTSGQTLDVYGRVEIDATNEGANNSDDNSTDTQGDMTSSARLGLKGSSQVNQEVSLFGKAEWQAAGETDDGNEFKTRYMYLGVDFGDKGKLAFGQQYTPVYTSLVGTIDIFDQWGMEAQDGMYGESRQSGQVIYTNQYGPLTVQAGYQFHNEDGTDVTGTNIGEMENEEQNNAYSAAIVYDTGIGLNLRAAVANQTFDKDAEINTYGVGADYDVGDFYAAFVYLGSRADNGASSNSETDLNSYDLVGAYVMNQYRFYTGYGQQRRSGSALADAYEAVRSYKLGVEYNITSNALTWVEYRHNDGDIDTNYSSSSDFHYDDASNQLGKNEIAVSAQYNF
ncbi:porin [Marinomonas pollencensis]|uniref:Putative porin n=1 Tax=Marinomonas pollencensis TaxID=491954 RepID=A0A3E0DSQ1_9GAMM|nr:porin [Marinomonas pollencensis]REG84981.1 putative porin [Marinomonas pollencensis]